ncbi:MAG: hypothetical protein OXG37_06050 [Actinomycetia bacterium]|nr:hypothetical protein [Actinomycetes bacterium]
MQALLDAKAILDPDDVLDWSVDTAVASWEDISVSNGRVTRLSAGARWLTGSIPAELGGLTDLTYFDLYDNNLTDPIPPELGDLTSLKRLYRHGNKLTGSIPSELGNLANLTRLYLTNNELSGSIPPQLGGFGVIRGGVGLRRRRCSGCRAEAGLRLDRSFPVWTCSHDPCPDRYGETGRRDLRKTDWRGNVAMGGHSDPFERWLDGQSEASLTRMLDTFAEQESEARLKARLVERALKRRAVAGQPDRSGGAQAREGTPARSRDGGRRFAGVSRETLLATVREIGRPVTPDELSEILVKRGHAANPESVRTALSRAAGRGELEKLADRSYVAAGDRPVPVENEA